MKILLISHQLDFSGAPIALLQLTRSLVCAGHEVFLVTKRNGPLAQAFSEIGVGFYFPDKKPYFFDLYIANTVLSVPLALNLAPSPNRVLAWIHETTYFFNFLRINPDSLGLNHLRNAAFPARFQIREFEALIPSARKFQLRNCVELPIEGDFELGHPYFVCTGNWEPRKNQARLIELMNQVSPTQRIVFVGANKPNEFVESVHSFLGQVSPSQARKVISQSQGLISAAQSEAQPLTAIEAILSGRPILLSDIPAHQELKESIPDILLFNPEDLDSFAQGIELLREQFADINLRKRLQLGAQNNFGRGAFNMAIEQILGQMQGS